MHEVGTVIVLIIILVAIIGIGGMDALNDFLGSPAAIAFGILLIGALIFMGSKKKDKK